MSGTSASSAADARSRQRSARRRRMRDSKLCHSLVEVWLSGTSTPVQSPGSAVRAVSPTKSVIRWASTYRKDAPIIPVEPNHSNRASTPGHPAILSDAQSMNFGAHSSGWTGPIRRAPGRLHYPHTQRAPPFGVAYPQARFVQHAASPSRERRPTGTFPCATGISAARFGSSTISVIP